MDRAELPKTFYALAYTWRHFRFYRTKTAAERALKAWKVLAERAGCDTTGSVSNGYRAWRDGALIGGAIVHKYEGDKRCD